MENSSSSLPAMLPTLANSSNEEMIQKLTTILVPVTFGIILSIGFIGNIFVIAVVSCFKLIQRLNQSNIPSISYRRLLVKHYFVCSLTRPILSAKLLSIKYILESQNVPKNYLEISGG